MKTRALPSAWLAWVCAPSIVSSACFSFSMPRGDDSIAVCTTASAALTAST